jgi:putative transposase
LKRNFYTEKPLQKLVADITYLPFGSKMLNLLSIMDLYNGEIIAYSIGDKQGTSLVIDNICHRRDIIDPGSPERK